MNINIHRPFKHDGWKSLNFLCFGEGDFFARQTVKLSVGFTKFAHSKWTLCNANLQNHNESQPLKNLISPQFLQHASAKPFVMIAACIVTNKEKNHSKNQQDPPLHQVYLFESDVLVRQKNKTRDFSVQNSSNFLLDLLPLIHAGVCSCVFTNNKKDHAAAFFPTNGGKILEVYTDSTVDAIDGPGTSTYPQATSLDLQSPVVEVCNPNSSK